MFSHSHGAPPAAGQGLGEYWRRPSGILAYRHQLDQRYIGHGEDSHPLGRCRPTPCSRRGNCRSPGCCSVGQWPASPTVQAVPGATTRPPANNIASLNNVKVRQSPLGSSGRCLIVHKLTLLHAKNKHITQAIVNCHVLSCQLSRKLYVGHCPLLSQICLTN